MARIVVGVDGSQGSRAALRWAHEEAKLRGATLEVVAVWQFPVMTSLPAFGAMPPPDDLGKEAESTLLATLSDEGIAASDDVPVTTVIAEGTPAATLLQQAEGADLLVVGSRGHGGFAGLVLGSVSHQCASHGPCPVVVVRSD